MKTKTLLFTSFAICVLLLSTEIVKAQPGSYSLVAPANGGYVSTLPYFDWGTSTGATYYQLYVDGTLKKDNITTSYYQLLVGEELSQGMHPWYIIAVGTGTTQSNETWSILVDATQPTTFNLVSPVDNSWSTNLQPTLTWSASSDANSGLAKYQLWIDGVLNMDNISVSATSTTPTNSLSNGSHTWEIRAVDNVGNVRLSSTIRSIKIDNRPPKIEEDKALILSANLSSNSA